MRLQTTILALFVALLTHGAMAQQNYITIKGVVKSNEHYYNSPVNNAEIFIKHTNIRTLTNEDGRFIINIPDSLNADTIIFSKPFLNTVYFNIFKLNRNKDFELIMQYATYKENEIISTPEDPLILIKKAIQKCKTNYIQSSSLLENYFSFSLTENAKPVQLASATSIINQSKKISTLQILDASIYYDTTKSVHLLPIQLTILEQLDPLYKKPFLKESSLYDIVLKHVIRYGEHKLYEFKFSQKNANTAITYNGSFAIDNNTYAFVWFDYTIIYQKPEPTTKKLFYNGVNYVTTTFLQQEYIHIDYRKFDQIWSPIFLKDSYTYTTKESGNALSKQCKIQYSFAITNHYSKPQYSSSTLFQFNQFPNEQINSCYRPTSYFNTIPLATKQKEVQSKLVFKIISTSNASTIAPPVLQPTPTPAATTPIIPIEVDTIPAATTIQIDTVKQIVSPNTVITPSIDSLLNSTPTITPAATDTTLIVEPIAQPTPITNDTLTPIIEPVAEPIPAPIIEPTPELTTPPIDSTPIPIIEPVTIPEPTPTTIKDTIPIPTAPVEVAPSQEPSMAPNETNTTPIPTEPTTTTPTNTDIDIDALLKSLETPVKDSTSTQTPPN